MPPQPNTETHVVAQSIESAEVPGTNENGGSLRPTEDDGYNGPDVEITSLEPTVSIEIGSNVLLVEGNFGSGR